MSNSTISSAAILRKIAATKMLKKMVARDGIGLRCVQENQQVAHSKRAQKAREVTESLLGVAIRLQKLPVEIEAGCQIVDA